MYGMVTHPHLTLVKSGALRKHRFKGQFLVQQWKTWGNQTSLHCTQWSLSYVLIKTERNRQKTATERKKEKREENDSLIEQNMM